MNSIEWEGSSFHIPEQFIGKSLQECIQIIRDNKILDSRWLPEQTTSSLSSEENLESYLKQTNCWLKFVLFYVYVIRQQEYRNWRLIKPLVEKTVHASSIHLSAFLTEMKMIQHFYPILLLCSQHLTSHSNLSGWLFSKLHIVNLPTFQKWILDSIGMSEHSFEQLCQCTTTKPDQIDTSSVLSPRQTSEYLLELLSFSCMFFHEQIFANVLNGMEMIDNITSNELKFRLESCFYNIQRLVDELLNPQNKLPNNIQISQTLFVQLIVLYRVTNPSVSISDLSFAMFLELFTPQYISFVYLRTTKDVLEYVSEFVKCFQNQKQVETEDSKILAEETKQQEIQEISHERVNPITLLREYFVRNNNGEEHQWISATQVTTLFPRLWENYNKQNIFHNEHLLSTYVCKKCVNMDNYNTNPLIICVGCQHAFHKTCLGNESIFSNQTKTGLCSTCKKRPQLENCLLCLSNAIPLNNENTILKEMHSNKMWVHKDCLRYFNLGNVSSSTLGQRLMDRIVSVPTSSKCNFCDLKYTAKLIPCAVRECNKATHTCCASSQGGIVLTECGTYAFLCNEHSQHTIDNSSNNNLDTLINVIDQASPIKSTPYTSTTIQERKVPSYDENENEIICICDSDTEEVIIIDTKSNVTETQKHLLEIISRISQPSPKLFVCENTLQMIKILENLKNSFFDDPNCPSIPKHQDLQDYYALLMKDCELEHDHQFDSEMHSRYGEALIYGLLANPPENFASFVATSRIFETSLLDYLNVTFWHYPHKITAQKMLNDYLQFHNLLSTFTTEQVDCMLRADICWEEWMLLSQSQHFNFVQEEISKSLCHPTE